MLMKLSRWHISFGLFLMLILPRAQAQVRASLVSADASVQPGRPLTLALHLAQAPLWHTYWVNPGTGLATSLAWTLPPGWKAGDIRWPAPKLLIDDQGNVTGNGYEGDLLLPVTLTPPPSRASGEKVRLAATASWLMCRDVCKPGEAVVSLTLPVNGGPPAPDSKWGPRIAQTLRNLPRTDGDWRLSASRHANNIILTVEPVARAPGHRPSELHFFADDNLVAYELPQRVKADDRGGFVLILPVSPDGPSNSSRLMGVITSKDGWSPDGSLPGLRVDVPLSSAAAPVAATAGISPAPLAPAASLPNSFGATLFLAFIGGLILNLMPCVFPVLGIKILGFVKQAGTERAKVVAHGLVFTSGVLLSFWVLAGLLAILRHGGAELGWGFQLQSPVFVFVLAALMLIFALNLSGLFEFGLAATGVASQLQTKSGYAGSFFTGVLATMVATPCSAPFLAPALGAALTLSFAGSFAIFTAVAIGLSMPYLLLSVFPGAVRLLPRPGAWMETFRQLMAFPLYAAAGYLIWVLAGQVQETTLLSVMFGLVVVAMGAWVYGRWRAPGATPGRARFGFVAGAALLALGLFTGWPRPPQPTDIVWDKWSPQAVEKLNSDGRIVYVDFTARWCATCQANKRLVFHSQDVLRAIRAKRVATLRGDWTQRDPAITAELSKYHRSAVPFNQIWYPGRTEPVILPEILTPGIVLKALKG